MIRVSTTLVRVGAGFIGLALLASLWASPNRLASLPWFVTGIVGVALVVAVTGRWLPLVADRIRPTHLTVFFIVTTSVALGAALLTSRWPSYKLSWLSAVYATLPSIRSLPLAWTQQGLQPNQTGAILAVCSALTAAIALTPNPANRRRSNAESGQRGEVARPTWRWIAALLSIAGVIVVFMTGSRAALAGLVTAILLVLILRTRRWLWAWGAGLGVVALGLYTSGRLAVIFRFFVHDETLDTKLVARLDIWLSAFRGIQDHPLTGIGLGVFNQVMPARYPYQTVGLSYPVSQAHNLFLDVALAIGLPGALGLLMLLLGLVLLAIAGLRLTHASRLISAGILASLAAFLVFGITDQISFSIPTSFIIWLWACSLAIIHERAQKENTSGV